MAKTEKEKASKDVEKVVVSDVSNDAQEEINKLKAEIEALKATPAKSEPVVAEKEVIEVQKHDLTTHQMVVLPQIIKNTRGEDVDVKDYFYAKPGETAVAPNFFNKACGLPVNPMERPELIEIFDKTFKPQDNFVFLKSRDKEVYSVLIPLKYTDINSQEDCILGDYQLHAISFIPDGSVNFDKLKAELKKIATMIKYDSR